MFSEILHRKTPSPQACNFVKKETPAQVFSSGSCEFSKNIFSYRTPPVAAFLYACYKKNKIRNLLRWTYKHRSRNFREIQKSFEKEDNIWTYGLKIAISVDVKSFAAMPQLSTVLLILESSGRQLICFLLIR